eukprot:350758-Chlamydomonas_euryale.AAC.13
MGRKVGVGGVGGFGAAEAHRGGALRVVAGRTHQGHVSMRAGVEVCRGEGVNECKRDGVEVCGQSVQTENSWGGNQAWRGKSSLAGEIKSDG